MLLCIGISKPVLGMLVGSALDNRGENRQLPSIFVYCQRAKRQQNS